VDGGKIHALRRGDEADDEAGCAVPFISSAVMASCEFMADISSALAEYDITEGSWYATRYWWFLVVC
jgi:hypothetical protein